jgi:cytochrome oxidase Cu insertion factor (SCO1/SenC/PrrC family)
MAMAKRIIGGFMAVLALAGITFQAWAAYPGVGKPAPPFIVSSASDEKLTLDMLRGRVIVLFYESRHVIRKNIELKNELKDLYRSQPDRIKKDIFRLVVIDCAEASWVTLPIWKNRLNEHSAKEGFTIYGDWTRSMLASYRMKDNESNFLIIDKDGIIRYAASGRIGNGSFEKIKQLLSSLVQKP